MIHGRDIDSRFEGNLRQIVPSFSFKRFILNSMQKCSRAADSRIDPQIR